MRVYVYVEGDSDVRALQTLMRGYMAACRVRRWGLQFISMKSKPRLLAKIGAHARERLRAEPGSHVVAMPDVYPTSGYGPRYAHGDYESLCDLLQRLVSDELSDAPDCIVRFHAHPFRHDMESLLLASPMELASYLHTRDDLTAICRHPVEDQDEQRPPKRVVEETFLTRHYRKIAYRDVLHAPAILRDVQLDRLPRRELPRFWDFLSTLEQVTGVPITA